MGLGGDGSFSLVSFHGWGGGVGDADSLRSCVEMEFMERVGALPREYVGLRSRRMGCWDVMDLLLAVKGEDHGRLVLLVDVRV